MLKVLRAIILVPNSTLFPLANMLPGRGAGHPRARPGGVGHQDLAQGGEGAEEVSRQLRQILNHQLQSPEVRRKVLIVTTVGKTQLEA